MILKRNEPLANHVTIRIGGVAKNYYIPESVDELLTLIEKIDDYYIISGGSNLLINDSKEFENVISMEKVDLSISMINDEFVYVGASVRIQKVINQLREWNFGGFEFLCSLPAYMGGIIYMNAGRGSDRKSISDFVISVKAIDKNNYNIVDISKNECNFDYRQSIFKNNDYIIIGVILKPKKVSKELSEKEMYKRLKHSKQFQDLRFPNFGSVFMKSNGKIMKFVKFLMRFKKKKGICYSDKTANWFINCSDGKYSQAIKLINKVKLLHKLFGKKCEVEVIIWE